MVLDEPVTTMYRCPTERVLFWEVRDANPFFHLFECIWMMAGHNDLDFVKRYVKRMETFSDDGRTIHDAYGYRWLQHFDVEGGGHAFLPDQLTEIVRRLQSDPNDRRSVLTMWDPVADLGKAGKAVPCNTHIYFRRNPGGGLNMTVCNRSNDIIWGAYGANAVHMSFLQEHMAIRIGCPVGTYWQVSNDYHAYTEVMEPLLEKMFPDGAIECRRLENNSPYNSTASHFPILSSTHEEWNVDAELFLGFDIDTILSASMFTDRFFQRVIVPMHNAYRLNKAKLFDDALRVIDTCEAWDWKLAAREWIVRRQQKFIRERDDGPAY